MADLNDTRNDFNELRSNYFSSRNPLKRTRDAAEKVNAKFIKSGAFFDGTPAAYVSAYFTIPSNLSIIPNKTRDDSTSTAGENGATDEDVKKQIAESTRQRLKSNSKTIRISNPPYNIIKSFQYDVAEGKVDAEFIDAGGELTNLLIKQLYDFESAIGTLSITFRYGWSTPSYPIKPTLIDDVANPLPKKFSKQGLTPRVRFSSYVTVVVNEIELEFTEKGVSFKISGSNKFPTQINPNLQLFTPYRMFGAFPLIEFGAFDKIEELIKKLETNKQKYAGTENNILQETVNESLEILQIPEDKRSNFFGLMLDIFKEIQNTTKDKKERPFFDPAKVLKIQQVQDLIKNKNAKAEEISSFYYSLITKTENILKKSEYKVFENKISPTSIVTSILFNSQGAKVNAFDALSYIITMMRYHIAVINKNRDVAIVDIAFLNKTFLSETKKEQEAAKTDKKSVEEYWNQVPVKSLTVDTNKSYEELIKDLVSYMKIVKPIDKKTNNFVDIIFTSHVAYGKDEIILRLQTIREKLKDMSLKKNYNLIVETINTSISKALFDLNIIAEIPEKIKLSKIDTIDTLIEQAKRMPSDSTKVLIFYIFSEYDSSDFFTTTDNEKLLNGYSYRPGGFKVGLEKPQGQSSSFEDSIFGRKNNNGSNIYDLKTNLSNTTINQNYFNTGTLNVYHNNFPDVLSFSPKVSFSQIRGALKGIVKENVFDIPEVIYIEKPEFEDKNKTFQEQQKDKTQADLQNEIAQRRAESENRIKLLKEAEKELPIQEFSKNLYPNANIISENGNFDALRMRIASENFRENLSRLLIGFEAELKIIGEPYYDFLQMNKFINLDVYAPNGTRTFYSGAYRITGISQEIQDGKFETTLKLFRENIDKEKVAEYIQELNKGEVIKKPNQKTTSGNKTNTTGKTPEEIEKERKAKAAADKAAAEKAKNALDKTAERIRNSNPGDPIAGTLATGIEVTSSIVKGVSKAANKTGNLIYDLGGYFQ